MKIVHVTDSFAPRVGGIERQVESLAAHQRADGHEVSVITAVPDLADIDLEVARGRGPRWVTAATCHHSEWIVIPTGIPRRAAAFPWRHAELVEAALAGADLVHSHYTIVSPLPEYVARVATRRGIPVGITIHSLWWQVAAATRVSNWPFGRGRSDAAWSAVSSVAAEHVRRTLPRLGEVSVVPNLVDTDWWRPQEPIRPTGQGGVQIALVGRLVKRKHVREFFDALAEARKRIDPELPVTVRVIGAGPRREDLTKQLADLGLDDWVTLAGHRPAAAIRDLLHQSDLFVASSRQESFGIAALEARAAGLPVLGFRGNGLSDFVVDGTEGLLVEDDAAMTDALTLLLGDPEELNRLRKNTTTFAPSIGVAEAMAAVNALYERAAR
jgi:glycosyltransferase involved in cell wall biosynthesis